MMAKYRLVADKYLSSVKCTIFDRGAAVRLPEEYRKFWKEWRETTPEPVHYTPRNEKWIRLESGEMKRIENVPLPGIYTRELNQVITGGEMIIFGFKQKHKLARRVPHFWMPAIRKSVIYSEVLNKHISVLITNRAIGQIIKHEGSFDAYVLKTKACDLKSLLALKLKRRILLALRDKNLPYDDEKNNSIIQKYKDCMMEPKEIEWYGLTMMEALLKLEEEEEKEKIRQTVPLKHIYRRDLVEELKKSEKKPWNLYMGGILKPNMDTKGETTSPSEKR